MSLVIPAHLRERQVTASDPDRSIWVSANAGSGKTHVLTQRVIRLLLDGTPPSKILCLTFTKAAAAQMATRVFDTLSRWTQLDDAKLRAAIIETGASNPSAADMLLARRLFTRTVETPGGLKIQTIHAFCERLLHLFPFEANVPARFEVADEKRTEEMLSLAKRAVIADARREAGSLNQALTLVADVAGASAIDALIAATMKLRAPARRSPREAQSSLAQRLGAGNRTSVESVRKEMIEDGLTPGRWADIAAILESSSKTDAEQGRRLRATMAAHAAKAQPTEILEAYLPFFFDGKKAPRNRLVTNSIAKAHPSLKVDLEVEQARLAALRETLKIAEALDRTTALLTIADAIAKRYGHVKVAGGLLDFDDLIERTLALLERSDAGWVLHKLDAGIDHVLVDEAQDTSEAQWRILERLTHDFATGLGGRPTKRSFFVVGDDKQSIFSFQGAAPLMFDDMRRTFEKRFRDGAKPFERVSLNTSFRSVPGILDAVDRLFAIEAHQDGLVRRPDIWPIHESIKAALPSLVEIWPRLGATAAPDPADWSIPLDVAADSDPASIVADRVAGKIAALLKIDSGETVFEGRGTAKRAIKPGDVLILVRTRNAFFEAVIRALKRHRVPVAGADRLDVANHIAVMDLAAAGRAALLPNDDLSVACVLKSPLFGLTDDDLIALAPKRTGALVDVLASSPDPAHREAHATIRRWAARATQSTPFTFYVELLGRDRGRFLMETRLGPEAHDAIDEFLRLALAHERQGAPSLGSFLDDVDALESSIKRDMEGASDAVRVMTVHAAKGLEAKIVFLPDTCAVPAPTLDPTVFDLNKGTGEPPLLVWSPRKADDPPLVGTARDEERQATMREYRRLLYVAVTRAEERLYIAGFYNSREPPEDCWNTMIETAFAEAEEVKAHWGTGDTVRRIVTRGDLPPAPPVKMAREQGQLGLASEWLFRSLATPRIATPVRPSNAPRPTGGEADNKKSGEPRDDRAFGSAVHLLLQHLPALPAAEREAAGQRFLAARAAAFAPYMHERALGQALSVIALPALAALFEPAARAEVSVIGQVESIEVRGTVDRLVVTNEAVIVADFKTGIPQGTAPDSHLEQMALYRTVLAPLWPSKPMRMLLVWTAGPIVVELDPAALDIAAARRLGPGGSG